MWQTCQQWVCGRSTWSVLSCVSTVNESARALYAEHSILIQAGTDLKLIAYYLLSSTCFIASTQVVVDKESDQAMYYARPECEEWFTINKKGLRLSGKRNGSWDQSQYPIIHYCLLYPFMGEEPP